MRRRSLARSWRSRARSFGGFASSSASISMPTFVRCHSALGRPRRTGTDAELTTPSARRRASARYEGPPPLPPSTHANKGAGIIGSRPRRRSTRRSVRRSTAPCAAASNPPGSCRLTRPILRRARSHQSVSGYRGCFRDKEPLLGRRVVLSDCYGCDLIVMATHGHTGLARVVLGSVADAVLRGGSTPVLLVRSQELREVGGGH